MINRTVPANGMARGGKRLIAVCVAILALTLLSVNIWAAVGGTQQQYIGEARAKAVALAHAGLTDAQATFLRAHLDHDDGRMVYDVEFYSGVTEYDYEIDALTGDIREYDRDIEYYAIPDRSRPSTNAGDYIGEAAARAAALAHAGVTEAQAVFIRSHLDHDDGRVVYEIDFLVGNTEYDYELDAVSGQIVSFDQEIEYYTVPRGSQGDTTPVRDTSGYIGDAKAISIALEHAGIAQAQTVYVNARLDYDDGREDYEVVFFAGDTEYDYEIDAVSGRILEYDRDTERRGPWAQTPAQRQPAAAGGDLIGEARAKAVALADAGLTEAQVTRMRIQLDRDDGRTVYEVDFNNGYSEYEYSIDATTGAVVERDFDYND